MWSILVLLIIFLISSIYYFLWNITKYWETRNFPTIPDAKLLFGHFAGCGKKYHISVYAQNLYNQFKERKNVVGGIIMFTSPAVIVVDIEILKHILVKDFHNFNSHGVYYNESDDPLSAHLFSLEGEQWKNLRTKLSPTFTSGKLKLMFDSIVSVGNEFSKYLLETFSEIQSKELEIKGICGRFTNDVIALCAFGLETNAIRNPDSEFLKFGQSVFEAPISLMLFRFFAMKYPNFSRKLHIRMHDKNCEDFYMKVIRETVEYREKNKIHRNDFLNLLLELKNNAKTSEESLTFNELAAQCFIFFLAGFETSSTTMTFALYELALNPELQDKLRDKINEAIAAHNGEISYECLLSIKYLDQVINETLRKYPPLDFTFRSAAIDYKVPNTDYIIPKDTFTIIPIYAIQHDPEYYPDPEKFDPDRFDEENSAKRNPFVFLPFGEGPRICIGLRFGLMQTRIGLLSILRNFKITPTDKTPIPMVFRTDSSVLAPAGGMHLKMTKL